MTNEDHGTVPGMLISEIPVPTAEDYGSVVLPAGTASLEVLPSMAPPSAPERKSKGMTFQVVVDTATNRSNVNLAFANADAFVEFVTSGLKSIADTFHVRVNVERLPENEKSMKATEL